jgi:epoxide hydrolase-like predicted phosphatase
MGYKAIGFDYGGVLAGEPGHVFGARVAELLGIDFDTYRQTYFMFNKLVNRGEIGWPELWQRFLAELKMENRYDEVMALSNDYHASLKIVKPELIQLLDTLKQNGYKLGLLSNNTHSMAKRVRAEGLDKHFDVFHVSAETKLVKPEIQAFSHFAESLQVKPEELIFIDDSTKSLSTSAECGYTPILYQNYQQLLSELDRLGISSVKQYLG